MTGSDCEAEGQQHRKPSFENPDGDPDCHGRCQGGGGEHESDCPAYLRSTLHRPQSCWCGHESSWHAGKSGTCDHPGCGCDYFDPTARASTLPSHDWGASSDAHRAAVEIDRLRGQLQRLTAAGVAVLDGGALACRFSAYPCDNYPGAQQGAAGSSSMHSLQVPRPTDRGPDMTNTEPTERVSADRESDGTIEMNIRVAESISADSPLLSEMAAAYGREILRLRRSLESIAEETSRVRPEVEAKITLGQIGFGGYMAAENQR